jgi:hypothetical protein
MIVGETAIVGFEICEKTKICLTDFFEFVCGKRNKGNVDDEELHII